MMFKIDTSANFLFLLAHLYFIQFYLNHPPNLLQKLSKSLDNLFANILSE